MFLILLQPFASDNIWIFLEQAQAFDLKVKWTLPALSESSFCWIELGYAFFLYIFDFYVGT